VGRVFEVDGSWCSSYNYAFCLTKIITLLSKCLKYRPGSQDLS
jgi:hypothetical protein